MRKSVHMNGDLHYCIVGVNVCMNPAITDVCLETRGWKHSCPKAHNLLDVAYTEACQCNP